MNIRDCCCSECGEADAGICDTCGGWACAGCGLNDFEADTIYHPGCAPWGDGQ